MPDIKKINTYVSSTPLPAQDPKEDQDFIRIRNMQQRAKDMMVSCQQQQLQIQAYTELVSDIAIKKSSEVEDQQIVPILEAPEEPTMEEARNTMRQFDRLIVEFQKCLVEKKESFDESTETAYEMVRASQELQKILHKQFQKIADGLIEQAKASKVLSWLNVGATVACTGMGVAITAVTIATGGIGAVLYGLQAAMMFIKGALTIAQGVFDFKQKAKQSSLALVKHDKRDNEKILRSHLDQAKAALQPILDALKVQTELQKKERQLRTLLRINK